jgi:hypothetical protein
MTDEISAAGLLARVSHLEEEVQSMKSDLISSQRSLADKIETSEKTIMAVLQPLHDASLKQAGFIGGIIVAVGSVVAVFAWGFDHLMDFIKVH